MSLENRILAAFAAVGADIKALLSGKQATLSSGDNIKTVNTQSLLGSGNVSITAASIGLGLVDNVPDMQKPISTPQSAKFDTKVDKTATVLTPASMSTFFNLMWIGGSGYYRGDSAQVAEEIRFAAGFFSRALDTWSFVVVHHTTGRVISYSGLYSDIGAGTWVRSVPADRAFHYGTQAVSTIEGLQALLDGKVKIPVAVKANDDIDTYRTPGDFYVPTNSIAASALNLPVPLAGDLEVRTANSPGVIQKYTTYNAGSNRRTYERAVEGAGGSVFGQWCRVNTTIDPPEILISMPSTGTTSAAARTGVAVAEYRGPTGATAIGAITFSAPDTAVANMYLFHILGKEYQTPQIYDEKVNAYRSGSAAAWSSTNRTSHSTKAVSVRMAVNPAGQATIIIGDVNSAWSYAHFTIMASLLSHNNATTDHLQGWTTALVTDLTGYTQVSADIPITPTVGAGYASAFGGPVDRYIGTAGAAVAPYDNVDTFPVGTRVLVSISGSVPVANLPPGFAGLVYITTEASYTATVGRVQNAYHYTSGKTAARAAGAGNVYSVWSETLSDTNVKTINGQTIKGTGDITVGSFLKFTYEGRGGLRTAVGEFAVVDLLGMFQFFPGETEIDDDESSFATSTGRWLLQCPTFDLIEAWNLPRNNTTDVILKQSTLFASRWMGRKLDGSALCSLTAIAANSTAVFTGSVIGARSGDAVLVTPPAMIGDSTTTSSRVSFHAWVSADDVVTVMLCNSTSTSTTTNAAIRTNWHVSVFQEI